MRICIGDVNNESTLDEGGLIKKGANGGAYLAADGKTVIKIYHKHEPSQLKKLEEMIKLLSALRAQGANVPDDQIVFPIQPVYNTSGWIIGFTMKYIDRKTHFPMANMLLDTFRSQHRITDAYVARIFHSGIPMLNALHSLGWCYGDFNQKNVFVLEEADPLLIGIDADSIAFGPYGSEGTELYLDPQLYGVDLSKPVFKPEHDRYSFAVMFFYMITQTHPYGGNYKVARMNLTDRAKAKISVFNPDVRWPDDIPALNQVLTPPLKLVFQSYFDEGKREPFPEEVIADYILFKDGSRPVQQRKGTTTMEPTQSKATRLVDVKGTVLHTLVTGALLHLIVEENGTVVYYKIDVASSYAGPVNSQRIELFDIELGSRFGLFLGTDKNNVEQTFIVLNPPNSEKLMIYMITDQGAVFIDEELKTKTFMGSGHAMFRTSARHLVYLVSHELYALQISRGRIEKQGLRTVRDRQTWFDVDMNSSIPRTVCMINHVDTPTFWLTQDTSAIQLPLALGPNEVFVETSVRFAKNGVLVMLITEINGEEYIRIHTFDFKGKERLLGSKPIKRTNHFYQGIHGRIYATPDKEGKVLDLILHPTDEGIKQDRLQEHTVQPFADTEQVVNERSRLYQFIAATIGKSGIVVIKGNAIYRIGN